MKLFFLISILLVPISSVGLSNLIYNTLIGFFIKDTFLKDIFIHFASYFLIYTLAMKWQTPKSNNEKFLLSLFFYFYNFLTIEFLILNPILSLVMNLLWIEIISTVLFLIFTLLLMTDRMNDT
jgi:hypothetical protein